MQTQCNKRPNSNSETLPLDLHIEILTRLPAKSIARSRCVSKLWESTLCSTNFTESFLTLSSSRPKLLFTCLLDHEAFFFTSPQPQPQISSTLTAEFHMRSYDYPFEFSRPVHGLMCGLNQWTPLKGHKTVTMPLICNPSTGESLTLPRVKTRKKQVRCVLGFDSIEKQFKVLCMTRSYRGVGSRYSSEHQVLTLGTGKKNSWKRIKCEVSHDPNAMGRSTDHYVFDGVCINGVLYYLASVEGVDGYPYTGIVCFDIRSEKFKLIRKHQGMKTTSNSILVNYKGKLAVLSSTDSGINTIIKLWTLKDAENHQWLSCSYEFLPRWKDIAAKTRLRLVGMTSTGEIVLSPNTISDSFYLLYYNPETETDRRVEIEGMEICKTLKAYVFLDHVEDVKLMARGLGS